MSSDAASVPGGQMLKGVTHCTTSTDAWVLVSDLGFSSCAALTHYCLCLSISTKHGAQHSGMSPGEQKPSTLVFTWLSTWVLVFGCFQVLGYKVWQIGDVGGVNKLEFQSEQ